MYDELIERIRKQCINMDCSNCNTCVKQQAADAIEELVAAVPKWHPVSENPERKDPYYARDNFIVRLQSGCIKELTYEFDNSDRCGDGYSPLFKEGWKETISPVTHWMYMPKFDPLKEEK